MNDAKICEICGQIHNTESYLTIEGTVTDDEMICQLNILVEYAEKSKK